MFEVLHQYIQSKISISNSELDIVSACFTPKKIRKKQYLLQEGNVCNQLSFICSGCLRLYRVDEKGQEHIIQFGFENWWISDRESYITQQPSLYHIDAIEDSEVLITTPQQLFNLKNKVPAFDDMMQQLQAKNFVSIQKRINAALSYTAEEKYNDLLQHRPEIIQRVPLNMVASYLGITRETLSRIRNQSAKQKL